MRCELSSHKETKLLEALTLWSQRKVPQEGRLIGEKGQHFHLGIYSSLRI